MKKLSVILMGAIMLGSIASCGKLKHVKFTHTFTANLTVPATDVINVEHTVFSDTIQTDVQKVMNDNETTKDLVNSAKAEAVTLTIKAPDAQTWSYVRDIKIYIWAPGMNEVWVASKANVNENGKDLELTVKDIELKDYLTSEKFVVKATATHSQPLVEPVYLEAKIRARFDANLMEAIK